METNIYEFDKGIYGFEDYRRYDIFSPFDNSAFQMMEAEKDRKIGFVLVPPNYVTQEYTIDVEEEDLLEIGANGLDDVVVLAIVSFTQEENIMSVNLKSPIILSMTSRKGKQIILDQSHYSTRHLVEVKT
jgi:flagellar assembly factor FliW